MSDEQRPRKFEPPPWEKEAFERFFAEQEARRAASRAAAGRAGDEPSERQAASGAMPASSAGQPPDAATEAGATQNAAKPQGQGVPEAQVAAMLIELKAEEPRAAQPSTALVDSVSALLVIAGVVLIVQAAVLFARTRATGAAALIGATASLLVLLTGVGFAIGAVLLFRKYHR